MATTATPIEYTAPTLTISPIRISTMVSTAHVGCMINLDNLWEQIQILPYWDLTDGILEMDYQGTIKGTSWKRILQKAPQVKKTFFFNQATLVIRREVAPFNWKEINIKLFRNGGVQMTGVRSEDMSRNAICWLINHIQATCGGKPVFEMPAAADATATLAQEQAKEELEPDEDMLGAEN